jgi:hypothetical protein
MTNGTQTGATVKTVAKIVSLTKIMKILHRREQNLVQFQISVIVGHSDAP